MNNASILSAKVFFQKRWIRLAITVCWGLALVAAIVDGEILYSVIILFIPLLLYLFIHKPFVFPFGLYAFSLPFEGLLSLTGAAKGPNLSKLLAVLSICSILLKGHFEKRIKGPDAISIWWVLFFLYGFASIAWGISQAGTIRLSTGFGLLLLYVVISLYKIETKEYIQLKLLIIIAGVVAALLTIYNYQSVLALKGISDRTSMKIDDRVVAINSLPFDILLSISLCVQMIINHKHVILRGLFFLMIITMMFAIILTGSRGGLSSALCIFIIYLLYIKNLNKKIAFALFIVLAAIVIIPFIPEFMIERINIAIEGNTAEGHASARTDIWIVGLYALKKYWLFGAGLENFPMAYDEFIHFHYTEYLELGRAPHNIYLGFFVELGIIGMFLMMIALFKHYKAISGQSGDGTEEIMLKATFWGMMVNGLSADIVWSKMFWFLFMMIIMHKNSVSYKYIPTSGS